MNHVSLIIKYSNYIAKARAVTRVWNRQNPDRIAPWEYVEEACLAHFHIMECPPGPEMTMYVNKYNEFARKLPKDLLLLVFDYYTK